MGSILSKLFGGGGNHHNHGNAPAAALPPPTSSPSSTLPRPQQQTTTNASLVNKSIPSKPLDTQSVASSSPPVTPAPINILEVEVDEAAFKDAPVTYTSTIKAQIDPTPPHPLELYSSHKTQVSITKETKITRESSNSQAPIATLDSDYEEEIAALEAENAEIVEAVTKIQAGVRGFLVRKQINKTSVKSNSVDDPTNMAQQQQDTILPPPENFENVASASNSTDNLIKPNLVSIKKRVETPIPGSPQDSFVAQDDTNYSILDSVDPVEAITSAAIANADTAEELEIFKKINEINQLLAARNDDDDIEIVPEPPKSSPNLQSSPIGAAAISSTSINNALNELDQTIQEHEKKLLSEVDDEVLVIESAFNDAISSAIQERLESLIPPTPQSPSVLVKAPSLEEEDPDSALTQEAAAIRIQAAFRGYEVRKSLSREPSPARKTEDEESVAQPEPVVEEDKTESKPNPIEEPKQPEPEPVVPAVEPQPEPVKEELIAVSELADEEVIQDPPEESIDPEPVKEVTNPAPERQPVKEELIPVSEISDEEVIRDPEPEPSFEPELKPLTEEPEPVQPKHVTIDENAQIIPDVIPSAAEEAALMNVAIKDGFGTVVAEMAAVDIEKSIKELEKSFDRDLLSDPTSEVAPPASAKSVVVADSAEISVEPATPDAQKQTEPPVFVSSEPVLPSRIPVLDRSKTTPVSILKEPSSPEPNAYLNLALPTCVSPMSDSTSTANDGGDETDDEADSHNPSPIPLRASSPSPFSKKRHRRHRNNKKK